MLRDHHIWSVLYWPIMVSEIRAEDYHGLTNTTASELVPEAFVLQKKKVGGKQTHAAEILIIMNGKGRYTEQRQWLGGKLEAPLVMNIEVLGVLHIELCL